MLGKLIVGNVIAGTAILAGMAAVRSVFVELVDKSPNSPEEWNWDDVKIAVPQAVEAFKADPLKHMKGIAIGFMETTPAFITAVFLHGLDEEKMTTSSEERGSR